jgi:RNA polymerase sigma-70 factor (ECF subfamily)
MASKQKLHSSQEAADFEVLFQEHWTRVNGVIYRLVGDPDEAQDLALETFWRLYSHPPRETTNMGGWLYRVALRLGYNALRAANRRQKYEQEAGRYRVEQGTPDPEDEVSLFEQRQLVRSVLARMNPRSAHILMLRHSGFSYAEIGSVFDIPINSMGTLITRAEKEFSKRYQAKG